MTLFSIRIKRMFFAFYAPISFTFERDPYRRRTRIIKVCTYPIRWKIYKCQIEDLKDGTKGGWFVHNTWFIFRWSNW